MSTQSPTPPTPKGPRNSRRNYKKTTTPSTQKASTLTTPPSSPPRTVSPRGTTTDSLNNVTLSKKKTNRTHKKPRDSSRTSPVRATNKTGHRHTASNPSNNITTPQLKDSPHYAGPTFHASPAPSALPIPSFFSKSFPDSDPASTLDPDSDSFDADADFESTPSKPKARPQVPDEGQKSTPLDFLFRAAVEARKSQPQCSPEPAAAIRSPQTDSKAIQQRKFNNIGAGGLFPLEMDGPDQRHSQIGPSFAPSYKDRMDALRSTTSLSPPTTEIDEEQRKAKTEALKSLLLNPRPQRPSSGSYSTKSQGTGFSGQSSPSHTPPHFATPLRTTSGPPATFGQRGSYEQKQPRPASESHPLFPPTHTYSSQEIRSQNSALRREFLSSSPGNAPGILKDAYHSPVPTYDYSKYPANSTHNPSHFLNQAKSPLSRTLSGSPNPQALDTKKMEDDLRRILKLDVNPGLPSSSIQSSFA